VNSLQGFISTVCLLSRIKAEEKKEPGRRKTMRNGNPGEGKPAGK